MRSKPGPPMTLANMRLNGVRSVIAACANCGRSADVNVDLLPETLTVPETGRRLRCSSCGGKTISTRPAWHTARRPGVPDHRRTAADVLTRVYAMQSLRQPGRSRRSLHVGFQPRQPHQLRGQVFSGVGEFIDHVVSG